MALLNNGRPAELVAYTLATLPDPADHVGSLVFVTDANSGLGAVAVARFENAGSPAGEGVGSPLATWDDIATYAVVA